MEVAPRLALWPGLCLTIVVYCLNMFGDAVRDLLDPRLRGGGGRLGAAATPEAPPGTRPTKSTSAGLGSGVTWPVSSKRRLAS